jgi:hydroxylamine reductase
MIKTRMESNGKSLNRGRTNPRRAEKNILKKPIYRDFLFHALKGVSMFAHRARQLSKSDPEVDRFIAEALGTMVSQKSVALSELHELLKNTLAMREQASELYAKACEPFPDKLETLSGPATMTIFTEPKTIAAQARGLGARKLSGGRSRYDYYWEGVCVERLGNLGGMATFSKSSKLKRFDIYGVLHKSLDCLTRDLGAFELMALSDQLEKESLKLANVVAAGDTLTRGPSLESEIARARSKGRKAAQNSPGQV